MPSRAARAFWVAAPGRGELRDEPLREPRADEVAVRARYSGISRGTEALVFSGRVPASEHQRMRAPFQDGEFPAPLKYGYANVGTIEGGARDGESVFVLFPHQTRYVVPAAAAHRIPAAVPPARAVLAANLETAINGLWDAQPAVGNRIVVIGAGTVGCLVAWLARRIPGTRVLLSDVNASRESVAAQLGVAFAAPDRLTPDSADLIVHTSGSPDGLTRALQVADFEATIVEMSWYGTTVVPLPLGEGFHAKRLTIRSSQVGVVAAAARPRWDSRRRLELALSLLTDSALDALITGESPFDSLPDTMARLAASPGNTICHRIRYD